MFDPFVIGCNFLNFGSFGHFLASDGLGTRGKHFLGPVSPPVQLPRGRRTQSRPFWVNVWVLRARAAFDLLLRRVYMKEALSHLLGSDAKEAKGVLE